MSQKLIPLQAGLAGEMLPKSFSKCKFFIVDRENLNKRQDEPGRTFLLGSQEIRKRGRFLTARYAKDAKRKGRISRSIPDTGTLGQLNGRVFAARSRDCKDEGRGMRTDEKPSRVLSINFQPGKEWKR
jgi:hypothetical protein